MDWGEQRYSTMTQINPENVGKLAPAWSYELGPGGGNQQATPLYSNGVVYTVTNWSIVAAVDAKTGKELWRYDPQADRTMTQPGKSRLCCGVNSRGVALYEGKVLVPVIDGRMQALDAATGKLLWSSWAIPEPKEGEISPYSLTMAARVAKGKVFIGNAGAEFPPFRGYVSAFDVNTGKELWKFYTTPADPSKGFENKAMEAAAKTWVGEWWKQGGGGSMWDGMAYDPDENLLYVGTGNGTVWSADVRNGGRQTSNPDNLYIASILAINADTGQLKWHFQCTPGDQWGLRCDSAPSACGYSDRQPKSEGGHAGEQEWLLLRNRSRNRRIHLGVRDVAGELGDGNRSKNRPSQCSPGRALFFHEGCDGISGANAQYVADVVQSEHGSDLCSDCRRKHIQLRGVGNLRSDPGSQNFGLNLGGARGGVPMASPPPHGPERKNADGSKCVEVFSRRGIPPLKRNDGSQSEADSRAAARYPWLRTWCFKPWATDA
jgi:outer membrane protein assembly factor BamB